MARTTKIPCEGVVYTARSDAHGTVTEIGMDAGAEAPPESDEAMQEERARYGQMIQELVEFEEAVARAEALNLIADDVDEDGEDTDLLT